MELISTSKAQKEENTDTHLVANKLDAEFIVYNPKEEAGLLPKRIEKGFFGCSRREQRVSVQADSVRKVAQGGEIFVFQIGTLLKVFTTDPVAKFKFIQYLELNDARDEFVISPRGGLIFTYSNHLRKAQIFSFDGSMERFVKYPMKYQKRFSDIVMARFTKSENLLILTNKMTVLECVLEDEIFDSDAAETISSNKNSNSEGASFDDAVEEVHEFKLSGADTIWLDFSVDADDFLIFTKEAGSKITRKAAKSQGEAARTVFDLSRLKDESDIMRFRSFKGDTFLLETQKYIHLISQEKVAASIEKKFLHISDSEEYLLRIIDNNLLMVLPDSKTLCFYTLHQGSWKKLQQIQLEEDQKYISLLAGDAIEEGNPIFLQRKQENGPISLVVYELGCFDLKGLIEHYLNRKEYAKLDLLVKTGGYDVEIVSKHKFDNGNLSQQELVDSFVSISDLEFLYQRLDLKQTRIKRFDDLRIAFQHYLKLQAAAFSKKLTESAFLEGLKRYTEIHLVDIKLQLFTSAQSVKDHSFSAFQEFHSRSLLEICLEELQTGKFNQFALFKDPSLKYVFASNYTGIITQLFVKLDAPISTLSYLLPPGKQVAKKGKAYQQFWGFIYDKSDRELFTYLDFDALIEKIPAAASSFANAKNSGEMVSYKAIDAFLAEISELEASPLPLKLFENISLISGNIETCSKVLESAFLNEYQSPKLIEYLQWCSLLSLMCYELDVLDVDLAEFINQPSQAKFNLLFDSILEKDSSTMILLKSKIDSIFIVYESREAFQTKLKNYLNNKSAREIYDVITQKKFDFDTLDDLIIQDFDTLLNWLKEFIYTKFYFEHHSLAQKLLRVLRKSKGEKQFSVNLTLDQLESHIEAAQLLYNFKISQPFSFLKTLQDGQPSREKQDLVVSICSEATENYLLNKKFESYVFLQGKIYNLKSTRSMYVILSHLQKNVFGNALSERFLMQIFLKKLFELELYAKIDEFLGEENVVEILTQEIFEMIVVESISKTTNSAKMASQVAPQIRKSLSFIKWESELKNQEEGLIKAGLILEKTRLNLTLGDLRTLKAKDILNRLAQEPTKTLKEVPFYKLNKYLIRIEGSHQEVYNPNFIDFLSKVVIRFLDEGDYEKAEPYIEILEERNHHSIAEIHLKLLNCTGVPQDKKNNIYEQGFAECDNPELLGEFLSLKNLKLYTNKASIQSQDEYDFSEMVLVTTDLVSKTKMREYRNSEEQLLHKFSTHFESLTRNMPFSATISYFLFNLLIDPRKSFFLAYNDNDLPLARLHELVIKLIKGEMFDIVKLAELYLEFLYCKDTGKCFDVKSHGKFKLPMDDINSCFSKDQLKEYAIVTKRIIDLAKDLPLFGEFFDESEKISFIFNPEYRTEKVLDFIRTWHVIDSKILTKAKEYGIDNDTILSKRLERHFLEMTEQNKWEYLEIIKNEIYQAIKSRDNFEVELLCFLKNFYNATENDKLKWFFEVLLAIQNKLEADKQDTLFQKEKILHLKALSKTSFVYSFREYFSFEQLMKGAEIAKVPSERRQGLIERLAGVLEDKNVYILAKTLPKLLDADISESNIFHMLCLKLFKRVQMGLGKFEIPKRNIQEEAPKMLANDVNYKQLELMVKNLDLHDVERFVLKMQKKFIIADESQTVEDKVKNLILCYQLSLALNDSVAKMAKPDETTRNKIEEVYSKLQLIKLSFLLFQKVHNLYENSTFKVLKEEFFTKMTSYYTVTDYMLKLYQQEVISSRIVAELLATSDIASFFKQYLLVKVKDWLVMLDANVDPELIEKTNNELIYLNKTNSHNHADNLTFEVELDLIDKIKSEDLENFKLFISKINELFIYIEKEVEAASRHCESALLKMILIETNHPLTLKLLALKILREGMFTIRLLSSIHEKVNLFPLIVLYDRFFKKKYETTESLELLLFRSLDIEQPEFQVSDFIDQLIYHPKEASLCDVLALRDMIIHIKDLSIRKRCLATLINFYIHDDNELLFNAMRLNKPKIKLETHIFGETVELFKLAYDLLITKVSFKHEENTKTERAIWESLKYHLLSYESLIADQKAFVAKLLLIKGKLHLFTQAKLYDELLSQIARIVASSENLSGEEDDGSYEFDFELEEIELKAGTEEYREFTKKLDQLAWSGRSLKYVLVKTIAGLVLETKYIDAAKLCSAYQTKSTKVPKDLEGMLLALKEFLKLFLTSNPKISKTLVDKIERALEALNMI